MSSKTISKADLEKLKSTLFWSILELALRALPDDLELIVREALRRVEAEGYARGVAYATLPPGEGGGGGSQA